MISRIESDMATTVAYVQDESTAVTETYEETGSWDDASVWSPDEDSFGDGTGDHNPPGGNSTDDPPPFN